MAEPELFPELTFAKSTDLKLAGIEKYNNEDSYVVKGKKHLLLQCKNRFKTGEIKAGEGGSIPTSYADYKDVSGVKLPSPLSRIWAEWISIWRYNLTRSIRLRILILNKQFFY
jgi:hypothetical protein